MLGRVIHSSRWSRGTLTWWNCSRDFTSGSLCLFFPQVRVGGRKESGVLILVLLIYKRGLGDSDLLKQYETNIASLSLRTTHAPNILLMTYLLGFKVRLDCPTSTAKAFPQIHLRCITCPIHDPGVAVLNFIGTPPVPPKGIEKLDHLHSATQHEYVVGSFVYLRVSIVGSERMLQCQHKNPKHLHNREPCNRSLLCRYCCCYQNYQNTDITFMQ